MRDIPYSERHVIPVSCPVCDGVGEWPEGTAPNRVSVVLEAYHDDRVVDVCAACRGCGLSTEGVRVGSRGKVYLAERFKTCGGCRRCKTSWCFVVAHRTVISDDGRHMAPLCVRCFEDGDPLERLVWYRRLWDEWAEVGFEFPWQPIETAVLNEPSGEEPS